MDVSQPSAAFGGTAPFIASEATMRALTDAMPQMVWSTRPDGYHDFYNAQWFDFTGAPRGSSNGMAWTGVLHPDDQERASALWQQSLESGEPYEIEYRLRHKSGAYRWTLGRALPVRDEQGQVIRWIGTSTDIDDTKRNAQATELMSRELSHRIKNIFAVINGLIGLSAFRDPVNRSFANTLGARIAALGRAHNFARPHSDQSRPDIEETRLHGLLSELLSPYQANDHSPIMISGDDPPIDDRSATPIALVFHELATNAAKFGALSEDGGRVEIQAERQGPDCIIHWDERGGPPVGGPPERKGFGTQLSELSVEDQLGGSIEREWRPDGLSVTLTVQADRLCGEKQLVE